MAAYDLEEQEQLANLKTWWKQYGNLVTWILLAVSAAAAGYQGWNWYQRNQSTQASMVFSVLQKAAAEGDMQRVKTASGELIEKFGGTPYASMGAMIAGKVAFDKGDLKTARAQLTWAAENAADEVRDLAHLRLAGVLLDEKSYDDALKQVGEPKQPAFAARFSEMKGDILLAQGKRAEAHAAYVAAIGKIQEPAKAGRGAAAYKDLLQQKADALGDAQ
jgi:predicted negative regulator of RcsB-dependent stress response